MDAQAVQALIEDGCGLIVGVVAADGRPFATRGSGLDLLDDGRRARLLIRSGDAERTGFASDAELDVPIAITGAEITSLRSVQFKGRLRRLSPGGATDMVRARRYCDAFVAAVGAADGLPVEVMERWMPEAVTVAEVDVHEVYDQTPGPAAGGLLRRVAP